MPTKKELEVRIVELEAQLTKREEFDQMVIARLQKLESDRHKEPDAKREKAKLKNARAKILYDIYRSQGHSQQAARDAVNQKLNEEFGKGYNDDHMRKELFKDLD